MKALATGADAVMIGRPYLYGLATCGEEGVRRVVEILRTEMVRTLSLMGCPSVADLDRSWIELPGRAERSGVEPRQPHHVTGRATMCRWSSGDSADPWTWVASHIPMPMSTANKTNTTARVT